MDTLSSLAETQLDITILNTYEQIGLHRRRTITLTPQTNTNTAMVMIPILHRNRLIDEWNRNEDLHINSDSYIHPTFDKSQQMSIGEKMHPANVACQTEWLQETSEISPVSFTP